MYNSEEIVPIYAQGIHVMDLNGNVTQVIIFEYIDKNRYYYKLVKKGGKELIEELMTIMKNMQNFLDNEIIQINGVRARAIVQDVSIGFRGQPERPYIEFYIKFGGPLKPGLNRYDDYYEEEVAEYDYEILWILPENAKIVSYGMAGEGKILGKGNILQVFVKKGLKVGGHEYIEFELTQ